MNLTKLFSAVFLGLALFSCNKETSEPNVQKETNRATTKWVDVEMSAVQDDEKLRVAYGVSSDPSGVLTGLDMVEKDVNLRIAVKAGKEGTPIINTYKFTKVAGRNYAVYSGQIEVPVASSSTVDEPYYISAVLLSEDNGVEYAEIRQNDHPTKVIFMPTKNDKVLQPDGGHKIYPNVPYCSLWQEVSLNSERTKIGRVTLKMKPLGTLLRFRIENTTSSSQDVHSIVFGDVSFTNKGHIDFLYSDVDGFPRWTPYSNISMEYPLPNKITLKPNERSSWYYIWLRSYNYTNEVRPKRVIVNRRATTGGVLDPIFFTNKRLPDGSVPVTFHIREGIDMEAESFTDYEENWGAGDDIYEWSGTTLDRLSEYAVAENGTSFVTDHKTRNTNVGYFSYSEAIKRFKNPVVIASKKYSLPSVYEWRSIIPDNANLYGVTTNTVAFFPETNLNIEEPLISINGKLKNYKGDYISKSQVGYAVRFKDETNKYRTAFRYEALPAETDGNAVIKITARYIGNDTQYDINNVSNESFWNESGAKYTTRMIPRYGGKNYRVLDPTGYDYNNHGVYWTSTARTADMSYVAYFNKHRVSVGGILANDQANPIHIFPVLLFERK